MKSLFAFIKMNMLKYIFNTFTSEFTKHLHSAHAARPQRAKGALEDPTTLPQRPKPALCLSMFKIIAAAWRSLRWHSAHTARTQRCWQLHIEHLGDLPFLGRCGNAAKTPLWSDRGLKQQSILTF